MKTTPLLPAELSRQNKSAWDRLYQTTAVSVWGTEPVGFLAASLRDFADELPPVRRVLAAAAGEGRNLPVLLQLGAAVTACDASAAALAKIPPDIAARVSPICCDLEQVAFPDAHFDFVLLSDVVETLPEPNPVLREMRRILVPGGQLLCNLPLPEDGAAGDGMTRLGPNRYLYRERYYYRFFSAAAGARLFASCGFQVVRQQDYEWEEPAHPQFRPNPHRHRSSVLLAEKPRA